MSTHHIRIADEAKQKLDGSVGNLPGRNSASHVAFKRARIVRTSYGINRIYNSRCGRYRVTHSKITLGSQDGYADRFYAMRVIDSAERVISKHKKLVTAQKACAKFHCQASNH